jgi:hypothetical protein
MITKSFRIDIDAPRNKVWKVLWDDASYRQWTSLFHEGSYMVTNGKEGDKVHFLAPGGSGMYSEIARNIPEEFMSFRHLGVVKDGKEVPSGGTEAWVGAMENYTLEETNGKTTVIVDMDIEETELEHFSDVFPKALQKVKELSEQS